MRPAAFFVVIKERRIRLSNMKTKQKIPIRKLSINVPIEFKPLIRQRAESLDLTVSQYIRRLVNSDGKSP